MDQSKLMKARVVRIRAHVDDAANPPVDGTTEPHITLSPNTPQGTPTMGFFLGLKAPTVETAPTLIGTTIGIIVWIRNPVTKQWFSSAEVVVEYGQAFVCFDVGAAEIFFYADPAFYQIEFGGVFHVHVGEL